MEFDSLMKKLNSLRELGNSEFRIGDYGKAELYYNEALNIWQKLEEEVERSSEENIQSLISKLYSNRALVRIKLGKPSQAVEDCVLSLQLEPEGNWKALYRMAQAQYDLFRFEASFENASKVVSAASLPQLDCFPPPPPLDLVRAAQILKNEVGKLRYTYRAPEMSALEKRTLFSDHHTLRVFLQDSNLANLSYLKPGILNVEAQLFIGNEFGLFLGIHLQHPLFLRTFLLDTSGFVLCDLTPSQSIQTFTEHGRAQVYIKIDIDSKLIGKFVQIRFETSSFKVMPVLSLPFKVIETDFIVEDYISEFDKFGLHFTCCREMHPTPSITVLLFEASAELGIAGKLWDGGTKLLSYLSSNENKHHLRNLKILELGAGTGALGIGCAQLGCDHVTITDLKEVIPQIEANILLNSKSGRINISQVEASECTWGNLSQAPRNVDLICFADCIYDPDYYDDLLKTLTNSTDKNGHNSKVLWAHRHRNPEDHKFFRAMHNYYETQLLSGPGPFFLVPNCPPDILELELFFGSKGRVNADGVYDAPTPEERQHLSDDVSIYLSIRRVS